MQYAHTQQGADKAKRLRLAAETKSWKAQAAKRQEVRGHLSMRVCRHPCTDCLLACSLALGCASSEAGEGEEEASTPVTRGTSSPGGEARGA